MAALPGKILVISCCCYYLHFVLYMFDLERLSVPCKSKCKSEMRRAPPGHTQAVHLLLMGY